MNSNLSVTPTGPDASGSDGRSPSRRQSGRRQTATQDPDAAPIKPELRLVIQQDGAAGTFVYTVIDRISGQVVHQIPREEVARMSERPDYAAGSLIKTRA